MSEYQTTYFILNSDHAGATGNSSNYTTTLANEINLNNNYEYEMAVFACTYPTPNPHTNLPIHITCDVADNSYIGNLQSRLVYKSNQNQVTPLTNVLTHLDVKNLKWVRVEVKNFATLNITILDSAGVAVPAGQNSSVTIGLRRRV